MSAVHPSSLSHESRRRANAGRRVVRAGTIIPFSGEKPARGLKALNAPLAVIDDGVIEAQDGTIVAVEPYRSWRRRPGTAAAAVLDLGETCLAPGLVNCHTHLELSHMHGKTHLGEGFHNWVRSLTALDGKASHDYARNAMEQTMADMAASGVAAVGDISSRMPETVLESARKAGLGARIFLEIFGSDVARFELLERSASNDPAFSLAGHAFYSTSGEAVRKAKAWCDKQKRPFSLHLAEHEDELACLQSGQGKFCDLLRERVLPPGWRPPGMRPVGYAASLGVLSPSTVAVHCVWCNAAEIDILAASGSAVCLCPRSNAAINVGVSPAAEFARQGALLVLGTDSLASNADCRLWREAEFFLEKNIFPAKALLRMATVNGASALGLLDRFGTLEKGKQFCYTLFPSETNAFFR